MGGGSFVRALSPSYSRRHTEAANLQLEKTTGGTLFASGLVMEAIHYPPPTAMVRPFLRPTIHVV